MFDHFNLLAPIYDKAISIPDVKRFIELLELPTEGQLLDAGGGTGRVGLELQPFVDGVVVTDISKGMLKQAREKKDLNVSQAQVEQLPFPEALFSRVLVVDALHHFRDQEKAIADLIRVLKPDGRLVIQEPDISRWQVKIVALLEKATLMGSHFHSASEIKEMAEASGGRVMIRYGDHFSVWICVQK